MFRLRICRSPLQMACDSAFSSWPNSVSRALGLGSNRHSPATLSMPPVPVGSCIVRTTPGLVGASLSSMNSSSTVRRITSPMSLLMSGDETLSKSSPATRFTKESKAMPAACFAACSLSTAALVGARTQSRRRSMLKGRMTRPYSLRLKSPRRRSATDQMKAERVYWFMGGSFAGRRRVAQIGTARARPGSQRCWRGPWAQPPTSFTSRHGDA